MIEKTNTNGAGAHDAKSDPQADQSVWGALYERIGAIALRRSSPLVGDEAPSEAALDRGARALRTLMGAAEIARRIKTAEHKDNAAHEENRKRPAFTDEDIRELYRTVSEQVDRIERETETGADTAQTPPGGGGPGVGRNGAGAGLGGSRP